MQTLLTILAIVILVAVIICIWKTAEYFNSLPESNKWRGILAWDVLMLVIMAIALIIYIAMH